MINIDELRGRKILLYGYGKTNKSVAKTLKKYDLSYSIFIDDEAEYEALKQSNPEVVKSVQEVDILFVSPGVSPEKEIVQKAKYIYTDIDLFYILNPNIKSIAVTGTNGKSTLVKMLEHILIKNGYSAKAIGNLGTSPLELNELYDWYIIEMSSYQLFYTSEFRTDLGIILNITEDHLSWHGTFDKYKKAKLKLKDISNIFLANDNIEGIENIPHISLSTEDKLEICKLILKELNINIQNIDLKGFQSLPHRTQEIETINNITYINDSKATNVSSTIHALQYYNNVVLIAGGLEKGIKYDDILPYKEKIRKIYVIGESKQLIKFLQENKIVFTHSKTLENAVLDATKEKLSNIVLLSPMCSSFDQFENFEERGDVFIQLVKKLKLEE